jgi:hypothetical protein
MKKTEKPPGTELAPLNAIRVETALSRYPVHRLARIGETRIDVREDDQETDLYWKVSYNSEYGQPGPLAYKVDTLIINRRIEEACRPVRRTIKLGSLHDICKELEISEGRNRELIKKALYQNASAFITARIRYRLGNGAERTLEAGFTRYHVIFTGEELPDGRKAEAVYIVLSDLFMQVLNGAMTRPLDYDYLRSLPPVPQRFYELLSYQMYAALKYDRPRARLTYSEFCARAPQTRHLDWERVRSQMNKVHRPHRQSGYVESVEFQKTVDAASRPDWLMLYKPGPRAWAEYRAFARRGGPTVLEVEPAEAPETLDVAPLSGLEHELIRRGVTRATAAELVRLHADEKIAAQVERLDWLLEHRPKKLEDPAAYLVGAIRDDYAPPAGFVSRAEQQRREETRRARDRQDAEQRRRRRGAEARERDAQRRAAAYWESLSPDQQARLDAASIAWAGPDAVAAETGPLRAAMQRLRREQYIRQMLDVGAPESAGP